MRKPVRLNDLGVTNFGELSKDEIKKLSSELSFEMSLLSRKVTGGTNWQKVLFAHIFADHVLTNIISKELKNPNTLDLDRSTFAGNIRLAQALGILPDGTQKFLKLLNKIRNSIAHNLQFKITSTHVSELLSATPDYVVKLIEDKIAVPERQSSKRLSWILAANIISLEKARQGLVAGRISDEKGKARLVEAYNLLKKEAPDLLEKWKRNSDG